MRVKSQIAWRYDLEGIGVSRITDTYAMPSKYIEGIFYCACAIYSKQIKLLYINSDTVFVILGAY